MHSFILTKKNPQKKLSKLDVKFKVATKDTRPENFAWKTNLDDAFKGPKIDQCSQVLSDRA
jgi:hypothetical protein